MEFKAHKYQTYCIQRILDTPKLGLYIDMGLGKTVISLTAVRELIYNRFEVSKVLVIAPKKVAESTWISEKEKWDHTKLLRVVPVLGAQRKRIKALYEPGDVYVINRENVAWLCEYFKDSWPFDMIIIDESSSFKSHKAKRFKNLARVAGKTKRIVELSGTPSPNGMDDLWAQIYLLDQGERLERRYTAFRERYFTPDKRGRDVIYSYKARDGTRDEILSRISDICVTMRAEDYIDLPDIVYQDIQVELSDKSKKAYTELESRMVLELPAEEEISVTSAAALSNKLLQLSNGAVYDDEHVWHSVHDDKLDAFLELLEALNGQHALVFYSFQSDKERILDALKVMKLNVSVLAGNDEIERWNAGDTDILLAHPASAAYGLNLQAGGHHVIWFGLTWNYELYSQANKRLHRQGQSDQVIVHQLVCRGTRDEDVAQALIHKDQAQDYVMQSLKARIERIRKG